MWILAGFGRALALAAFCAVGACSAVAQDSNELQARLTLFQNAQATCKARVLMDSKLATNFVTAKTFSLTQVCECSALISVANVSKEQLNSLVAGDESAASVLASEVWKNFVQCLKLH